MILNPKERRLYELALRIACNAHKEQFRKYTFEPYILHPIDVAEMLRKHEMPIHVIAAGVLHDVAEDTDFTIEVIRSFFGDQVTEIVRGVTNTCNDKTLPRAERFWYNLANLWQASGESHTVKYADIISNLRNFHEVNPEFKERYAAEKSIVLEHIKHGDPELYDQAREIVKSNIGKKADFYHEIFEINVTGREMWEQGKLPHDMFK